MATDPRLDRISHPQKRELLERLIGRSEEELPLDHHGDQMERLRASKGIGGDLEFSPRNPEPRSR